MEGMLQFVLEMLGIRPAIFRACGRHVGVALLTRGWNANRRGSHAIMERLKKEMLR
jgi:predicted RNA binding protein YcfA (HicA-like mRNA interferase family)